MASVKVASKTSPVDSSWFRDKKVSVPWKVYERARRGEVFRVLDLRSYFEALDRPVQGRIFKQSSLVLLLVLKIFTSLSYRAFASFAEAFRLHELLGEDRPPSYKTINNAMDLVSEEFLLAVNKLITPKQCRLAGMDSSGLKLKRKGAWVTVRFFRQLKKRDFNKLHLLVDLEEKKILHCCLTQGNVSDFKGAETLLEAFEWIRIEVVLGDGGYDSKPCFERIAGKGAVPGIKVRENAQTKAKGSPARRKAVLAQKKDYEEWKKKVEYTMRCIVECIFSGLKRRQGEHLSSRREDRRKKEAWLRIILWNTTIYPHNEENKREKNR